MWSQYLQHQSVIYHPHAFCRPSANLNKLLELALRERPADVLELDRLGHQVVHSHDLIRLHHFLWVKLHTNLTRDVSAHVGKFCVNLECFLARIHPVYGVAISLAKAHIDVRLALQAPQVRGIHADGVIPGRGKISSADENPDFSLAHRLNTKRRRRPSRVYLT